MNGKILVYGGYNGTSVVGRNELREVWANKEAEAQKYMGRFATKTGISSWGINELSIIPSDDCTIRINEGSEITLIADQPFTIDKGAIWSVIFLDSPVDYKAVWGY